MSAFKSEWSSSIIDIRAVEDAIRSSKQYTEELVSLWKQQKHPMQGEDHGSRAFTKRYNVYPGVELSWEMHMGDAMDWLISSEPSVDVSFYYDYRHNRASVSVSGGPENVKILAKHISGFSDALARAIAGERGTDVVKEQTMGDLHRSRDGVIPNPQPIPDPTSHRS